MELHDPVLKVWHDEDYEVYVNGHLLYAAKGYGRNYKYIRLEEEANQLFQKGKNVLAVHCQNEYGNQYIDIGIGQVGEFVADRTLELNTVPPEDGL